jgi:hypothetical protein
VKNRGGKVPTGDVGKLRHNPARPSTREELAALHDWRDGLSWGYGRVVREIQGRWLWAGSYSDRDATRDVETLIGILSAVQTELDEARADAGEILPYAVCGCRDDSREVCPVCVARSC